MLHARIADFPAEKARLDAAFYIGVAHFRLLTPAGRLAIVQQRSAILWRRRMEHIPAVAEGPP